MRRTWFFGILTVGLTLFLIGYTVRLQKQVILKEAQVTMSNLLSFVEMDLERAFFGLDQVFIGLENYVELSTRNNDIDPAATKDVINSLLKKNPYLTALMVINPDGSILHWNNTLPRPNLSQRDYFRVHIEQDWDGIYIGKPQKSIVNKDQFIFGISRAFYRGQDLKYVIAAIMDVKYFYREYEDLFRRADTRLSVYSPEKLIYFEIPDLGRLTMPESTWADQGDQEFSPDSEDLHFQNINGEKQLTTSRKVAHHPLFISVAKTENAILSGWYESAWAFALLGTAISLILLFLTSRIALYQRQQEAIQERLRRQATTDPLTRVFNRRYVLDHAPLEVKKAHRTGSPLSIILLDLDYFKEINDAFGHETGDNVLKIVARLLKNNMRETDTICRFGGEEFLLVLPGTDFSGACRKAEDLRRVLEEHVYQGADEEFQVTGSFGVTQVRDEENDIAEALRRADDLLYQAKKIGRNRILGGEQK